MRASDAALGDLERPEPADALAAEDDASGVLPVHAVDRVEERRLARAVGADDRPALAFANAERDAVDGAQRAEADREAVEFEQLQDFLMPWNERL
jgi:hypothetical protein